MYKIPYGNDEPAFHPNTQCFFASSCNGTDIALALDNCTRMIQLGYPPFPEKYRVLA